MQPALTPQIEVACTVCGSAQHAVVATVDDVRAQLHHLRSFHRQRIRTEARYGNALAERAEFTQDYATDIVVCASCGLLYRDPRPSASAIFDAYAHDHYGSERLEALFDSQLELYRPKVEVLRRWLDAKAAARVVEVGSFVGGFLAAAHARNWQVIGIDPGKEVAEFCLGKGLTVRRETLEDCKIVAGSLDCVAIWNTFDQLPFPHTTLAAVRRLLKPGGILAVRVPNGPCFQRVSGWMHTWPLLRSPLAAILAWNNLLGFPYLHGYSVPTLDSLLAGYDFKRLAFQADVLTRLADARTKAWAAWEESALKTLCRAANALDITDKPRGAGIAPWFDAYYQHAPTLPQP